MKISIRPMQLQDAQAINSLSQKLGYEISIEDTQSCIQQILQRNDDISLVATIENNIVGWIHAFKAYRIETKPFIEIGGLVVDETHRGKGIGKLLVNEIKNWCIANNIYDLRVRCNTKRKDSHQFYRQIGFTEMKEQKVFKYPTLSR
jgi:GNAT superfamily N-acetyltransferase